MKVCLWTLGAPSDEWVRQGEDVYKKRIERYLPFEYKVTQPSKSKQTSLVLAEESKWILQQCSTVSTKLVLLDEKGQQFTSVQFSQQLEAWRQGSHKRLLFLIGSAYGFDQSLYDRADHIMGLASMTLPHQLCRLMMLEQLYRACTILRGESYHHI